MPDRTRYIESEWPAIWEEWSRDFRVCMDMNGSKLGQAKDLMRVWCKRFKRHIQPTFDELELATYGLMDKQYPKPTRWVSMFGYLCWHIRQQRARAKEKAESKARNDEIAAIEKDRAEHPEKYQAVAFNLAAAREKAGKRA